MLNFGGLSKPRLFMIKQKSAIMKKFFIWSKRIFYKLRCWKYWKFDQDLLSK